MSDLSKAGLMIAAFFMITGVVAVVDWSGKHAELCASGCSGGEYGEKKPRRGR